MGLVRQNCGEGSIGVELKIEHEVEDGEEEEGGGNIPVDLEAA